MGCQLVSPKLVHRGELVKLHVTNAKVEEPLDVAGRVAWVSPQSPWRVGVAFDGAALQQTTRWFELLVAAYPGLGGYRRVPDRIRADSTVYLGPPPKFLLDFNCDEAELLRAIASGARLDELMARLRDCWPAAQRALFSLIARQAVTFQRGHAVHPDSWKKILTDVEASLAIEAMGKSESKVVAPPVPFTPVRPERPAPRRPGPRPGPGGSGPRAGGLARRASRSDARRRARGGLRDPARPRDARARTRLEPVPRDRAGRLLRRGRRVACGALPQRGGAGRLRQRARGAPGRVHPRGDRLPPARPAARAGRSGDRRPAREARLQGSTPGRRSGRGEPGRRRAGEGPDASAPARSVAVDPVRSSRDSARPAKGRPSAPRRRAAPAAVKVDRIHRGFLAKIPRDP